MLNIKTRPGALLENYMNQVCEFLNNSGFHAHKNNPLRTFEGKYIEGEPFDYEFFIKGRVYCFDAKECKNSTGKWKILMTGNRGVKTNLRLRKQAMNLLACRDNGAVAFFLVAFTDYRFKSPINLYMFDPGLVLQAIDLKHNYLSADQAVPFDINKIINQ